VSTAGRSRARDERVEASRARANAAAAS